MSSKGSTSLLFNRIEWNVFPVAEGVTLLQAPKLTTIEEIHSSTKVIEEILRGDLLDIVPAYDSIAIFCQRSIEEVVENLENATPELSSPSTESKSIEIPICYELGLDIEYIAEHIRLSKETLIEKHLAGVYRALFIGFTPGFIYADGLDPSLTCPRKANPRTKIDAGSVGIGGEQTGIYSLASPGGWNIIGRTPMQLFDLAKQPPMAVEVGTLFKFRRITLNEFETWAN